MGVKRLKPTTPGQRFQVVNDFAALTKQKPLKSLLYPVKKTNGRNNQGKITVLHRGGGHKRKGRIIDFKRRKWGVPGVVKSIEYDPMRTAFIMLVVYKDGEKSYLIAPKSIQVGKEIVAGNKVEPEIGNAMPLKNMPLGTTVHNIELNPGAGAVLARSAGTYAQVVARQAKHVVIKLPSKETRLVQHDCLATVGIVSNGEHSAIILGKAGKSRWRGRRPRTRGVAMNPVDHPMGGGEGKASGGHPRSRKGLYAKGQRTRNRKKYSQKLIIKRKK